MARKKTNTPALKTPQNLPAKTPGKNTTRRVRTPRRPYTALVTGSAKGIGAAMAVHLAERDVTVAIHYRGSRDAAEEVLHVCQQTAPDSILLHADLTDADEAAAMCDEAWDALGGIDLLVNNVGNYLRKDVLDLTPEEWRDQIESNLYSAFYTSRVVIPRMMARGYGRVVNIGYAGGQQAFYNKLTVPYHIAKTGVHILTRSMGAVAARKGVTVNCIGMGVIENSIRKPKDIPAGRVGLFADVVNALDFFISPDSAYINGTQIDVSGAWLPEQIL